MTYINSKIWTKYNLNEKGNPLPQYENFTHYLAKRFTTTGYLKVFDSIIQLDMSKVEEQNRTLSYFSFTFLVDRGYLNSDYQEKCLIDAKFLIADNGTPYRHIAAKPIHSVGGQKIHAVMLYRKTASEPTHMYQVQIYVYLPVSYTNFRISFLDFYTRNMPDNSNNRYKVTGNDGYNVKQRMDYFVGYNVENNNLIDSFPSEFTALYSFRDPFYEINYSSGKSLVILPETRIVNLVPTTAGQRLDTITLSNANYRDQNLKEITLIFYNGYTTLVSNGNIDTGNPFTLVLKGLTDVTPTTKGQAITFKLVNSKWLEISRNF
jgi:hypothetical protein